MKEYKLNVNPRILELLGPNLYTNIYYVLAELIANAYDADAKNVYIISSKDSIRVEDDGHGMSYENGEVEKYLQVAGVSRSSDEESFSKSGRRLKMGRKGVGKLAALSVSENVDVLTNSFGEKSGFVLTRYPKNGVELEPISEDQIVFTKIKDHGSAIVMKNPQYRLHQTLSIVKKNLVKMFPMVGDDFAIHIIRDKETVTIKEFDVSVMKELSTLITLGESFSYLGPLVPNQFPKKRSELVENRGKKVLPIEMQNLTGRKIEYLLEIEGWIGTYKTTRGRKTEITDFPDNFISLFANQKLGEFNVLPVVGQNKLSEVYVVGQLHVNLFELSELPDMALSNRQGYKSDDLRYIKVRDYVRKLLADILKRRDVYTNLVKNSKKKKLLDKQKEEELKLRKMMDSFRKKASEQAAKNIAEKGESIDVKDIEDVISNSISKNSPDLGFKAIVDSLKKKILISQTSNDKAFADIVYSMLIYNSVPPEDVLYTNCDDEICRIPDGVSVYEYLRDFFVESYSTKKIFVLFVTSENTSKSWGAITEVGAAWITQVDHRIFNVDPFKPQHPLNNEQQWQNTNRENDILWMSHLNADIFCQKIEAVCSSLGYQIKSRVENKKYLESLVEVR